MGFLRHDAIQKYQRTVLLYRLFFDLTFLSWHLYYPSTGCSPAEPVSVYTDGAKVLNKYKIKKLLMKNSLTFVHLKKSRQN